MTRAIALALVLVCIGAFGAAASGSGRTVEKPYEVVTVHGPLPSGSIYSSNGVTFRTLAHESLVMMKIDDDTGTRVPARLGQDVDGDRIPDTEHEFCGATDAPVAIRPGFAVTVWMGYGSCGGLAGGPGKLGAWTTGTITATFSL